MEELVHRAAAEAGKGAASDAGEQNCASEQEPSNNFGH